MPYASVTSFSNHVVTCSLFPETPLRNSMLRSGFIHRRTRLLHDQKLKNWTTSYAEKCTLRRRRRPTVFVRQSDYLKLKDLCSDEQIKLVERSDKTMAALESCRARARILNLQFRLEAAVTAEEICEDPLLNGGFDEVDHQVSPAELSSAEEDIPFLDSPMVEDLPLPDSPGAVETSSDLDGHWETAEDSRT